VMTKLPIFHEAFTSISYLSNIIIGKPDLSRQWDEQYLPDLSRQWDEQYLSESVIGSLIHATFLNATGKHDESSKAVKGAVRAGGQAICLSGLDMKLPVLRDLSAAGRALGHAMAGDLECTTAECTVHHKNDAVLRALVASDIEKDTKERSWPLERAGRNQPNGRP
ncbi:hypothetical protein HK405_004907, partial [Cladochytrium tenue]